MITIGNGTQYRTIVGTMAERLNVVRKHLQTPVFNPTSAKQHQGQFQYTVDNDLISYGQRSFYEQNGYLVIPKLIEEELIDECCSRFIDLCDGKVSKGGMTLMRDISLAKTGATGQYLYNKAQDILYDEVFERYILHDKLIDYVSCFTGPNVKAMHSMLINKPPDSGSLTSRHPLHQDLAYFPFRPANRVVAAWTAMEKINLDNGCLVVIPGSHKGELKKHEYPEWEGGVNKAYFGIQGYDDYQILPLTMEKGDTVFFHPILIHGSGANKTKGFRKAISCHYASSDCYYINVEGTVQENVGNEILNLAKSKGLNVSLKESFNLRSRLVRGHENTL